MNRIARYGLLAGVSVLILAGSNLLMAQGGGGGGGGGGRGGRGGDPAAMQAAMLERMKTTLGVTDDAEWQAISAKLTKVMTLRREATGGGFGGGMMGGGRGGRGGQAGQAGATTTPSTDPTRDALQKAIESGDPAAIKTALAAYYAKRATAQANLKTAMEDLKKLLTAKQEAILALQGYNFAQ